MLKMQCMPLGDYQTNCYVISDDTSPTCAIIDPGYEPERILAAVTALGKTVEAILLTHGHFDHVGGVRAIAEATHCRVYLHEDDLNLPPYYTNGPLFYTDCYEDGDTLFLAGLQINVLHTPGHTPGSVCLTVENALFSGDTLFRRSCGRSDIGGHWETLMQSLRRFHALSDCAVFPGHGGSTTLYEELKYNPYMR